MVTNYPSHKQDYVWEEKTNLLEAFCYELSHMDSPALAVKQELIYTTFVSTLDAVLRTKLPGALDDIYIYIYRERERERVMGIRATRTTWLWLLIDFNGMWTRQA